jgi:hypothetical protein
VRTTTENTSTASTLLWKERLRAARAEKILERRAWLKKFALGLAVIALTLIAATMLANGGAPWPIR